MSSHRKALRGAAATVCWAAIAILGSNLLTNAVTAAPTDPPTPNATGEPPLSIPSPMPSKPGEPPPTAVTPAPMPAPAQPATGTGPAMPVAPTAPTVPAPIVAAPAARVYVLNGVDPFGWANLRGMADRLRGSGYDTRYGGWYQSRQFEREIRQEPGTPVAIVGYSFGVYRAKAMANRLTRDGVPVAMVGYVGGDYLRNATSDVPGGVRVVNVTGNGFLLSGRNLLFNGTNLSGADNVRLGVRHFDLPKQQQTFDALVAGLNGTTIPTTTTAPATVTSVATADVTPALVVSSSPAAAAATSPGSGVYQRNQSSQQRPLFRMVNRTDR